MAASTSSLPFLEADLRCDSSGWPKTAVRDFVEQAVPAITQYCSIKLQILLRDLLVTMTTDAIARPFAKVLLVAQRTRRA